MDASKSNILSQLQREILPLQGFKKISTDNNLSIGFEPIENSFPHSSFPVGCMHEFICKNAAEVAATNGFISCLLSKLMQLGGVCLWIGSSNNVFPVAMKNFNIEPEQIIFIDLKKQKDILYATEEALKCNKLTAVLSDVSNVSFKESRRFQLATEKSRTTGFIIRQQPKEINTIACVSRWHISSVPSEFLNGMPGVGFPRWKVELLKVRNGTTGKWIIEWSHNTFKEIIENSIVLPLEKRKAI